MLFIMGLVESSPNVAFMVAAKNFNFGLISPNNFVMLYIIRQLCLLSDSFLLIQPCTGKIRKSYSKVLPFLIDGMTLRSTVTSVDAQVGYNGNKLSPIMESFRFVYLLFPTLSLHAPYIVSHTAPIYTCTPTHVCKILTKYLVESQTGPRTFC